MYHYECFSTDLVDIWFPVCRYAERSRVYLVRIPVGIAFNLNTKYNSTDLLKIISW
jgi:hypothetical protein